MPFYLRKSVSAGPFRFNFSKGGIGLSIGVKGLRVGLGPRGHYIHAGRGGIYYRASLGPTGARRRSTEALPSIDRSEVIFEAEGVELIEIESGDVQAMTNETFSELLGELNAKHRQFKMSTLLGWSLGLSGILVAIGIGTSAFWLPLLALPGWLIGRWLDSYRRTSVLFYNLEPEVEQKYKSIIDAFDNLMACKGKWHIQADGSVRDITTWKRNAGADRLVKKTSATLAYKLPRVIKSNITPPAIYAGKQVIYFLPDVALIEDGKHFGAVGYSDLQIDWRHSNFIEEGRVPGDTQIIRHTWKHPNRDGGPDRRFKRNYRIPVCRYEAMHLSSASGVNELVKFSKAGVVLPFASAIEAMSQHGFNDSKPLTILICSKLSSLTSSRQSVLPSPHQGRRNGPDSRQRWRAPGPWAFSESLRTAEGRHSQTRRPLALPKERQPRMSALDWRMLPKASRHCAVTIGPFWPTGRQLSSQEPPGMPRPPLGGP